MDANDLYNALEGVLGIGDTLDNSGGGVLTASNGEHTTRSVIKLELGTFLLYIGNGGFSFNDNQAALVNMCLSDRFGTIPAWQMPSVAQDINSPDPDSCLSFTAFDSADSAIAEQKGEANRHAMANVVINLFDTFGNLMVSLNENVLARSRYERYMNGLRARLAPGNASVPETAKPAAAKPAAAKPAAPKQAPKASATKKKGKGGSQDYDGTISFILPSGYQMDRETGDDGEEKVFIRFGPGKDDNGNDTWEFSAEIGPIEVVDGEDDKIPAGERPLQTIIRRNAGTERHIMLSEEQRTILLVREAPLNILGRIFKFYALMLIVERDDHSVVSLNSIRAWDEEDQDKNLENYQHMTDMIGAIRINGKALPQFNKTAEELLEKMAPEFEGKTSIKGSIGLQIKNGDDVVSESVLVGDDDGQVHSKHTVENKEITDGKYGDLEVKNGWVVKCLKKAVRAEVPAGVVGIEDNAFEKCTKLEEVILPEGVQSIGSNAFDGCIRLKKITIPDSVNRIGMWAFDGCKSLIEVNLPASLTYISMYTFNECEKLESVSIPASVKKISSCAFEDCKSLKNIMLPDGLVELSNSVFWGCGELESLRIPDGIKEIENNLFYECVNLKRINIPDGVTKIGPSAFSGCENLESIAIPDSVDEIGEGAFRNCKKLKTLSIPPDVTVIDERMLMGCESLTEVTLPEGTDSIKEYAFSECRKLKKIDIPDGVSELGSGAFDECESLVSITIPAGITDIPDNLCNKCKSLKKAVLPETLKTIGRCAFNECISLLEIMIPDSVESIGDYGFDDCTKLTKISMPGHEVRAGRFALPDEEQAQITFRGPDGRIIPLNSGDSIFGNHSDESDEEMSELEEKCEALGCSVWNTTLYSCENKDIEEIEIPDGITVLGSNVFSGCSKLRSVRIPDTVTEIQMSAFSDCPELEEIEIPDSVTKMQGWVFENDPALKKVRLPARITIIGTSLFSGCKNMPEIEIPDGVTEIEDQAFDGCSSLREITLPDSIEKIGSWVFDGCESLETIYMPDKEIQTGLRAIPEKAEVVKIPAGDAVAKQAAKRANATERYTRITPADEIYSHYGKLKREHDKFTNMGIRHESNNGTEHEAIPLTALMERQGKTNNDTYRTLKKIESGDRYDLKGLALKMAQVFRVDQSVFNSRHDDEGEIGVTMLDKKWKFSALRSFAWTLADMADREGKNIDDYDTEDLLAICGFIKKRQWLNYEAGSWFDGLCGHNDIHVFYMPQKMIDDGSADAVCELFNFNPIVSLDAFRSDLALLRNPMIRIHNRLLENRDRSVRLDSPEAAVLKAWCSMAMSAETAFFSEDGPMMFFHSYPEGAANTQPIPVGAKAGAVRKAAPKAKKEEASAVMNNAASYEIVKGQDGKDRIKFGSYPAGSPVIWLVMENNSQDLLLLSEYGLDAKAFNDISYAYDKTGSFGESTNEWHNCSLRQWLNDEFFNEAFTPDEKNMILADTHETFKMSSRGEIEVTPLVTDKVWLLSAKEGKKFFPDQRSWICKASDFAKEHGAEIESGPMQCHWWMRSPAVELMQGLHGWTACAMADGNVKGWGCTAGNVCVRPVIRVRKDLLAAPGTGNRAKAKPAAEPKPAEKKTGKTPAVKKQAETPAPKSAREQILERVRRAPALNDFPFDRLKDERKKWVQEIYEILKELYSDEPAASYAAMKRDCPRIDWEQFEYFAGPEFTNHKTFPQFFREQGLIQESKKAPSAAEKKPAAKASSKTEQTAAKPKAKAVITPAKVINGVRYPRLKGSIVTAGQNKEEDSDMPYVIPEGVTEIEQYAFNGSKTKSITCPKSLRIIRNSGVSGVRNLETFVIQEGLEEIYGMAFAFDRKLTTIHLPSTIRKVARDAFRCDLYDEDKSETTIYISGIAARRLVEGKRNKKKTALVAKGFVIDGKEYQTLEEYVNKSGSMIEDQKTKAQEEQERAERIAQAEREKKAQIEQAERDRKEKEQRENEARKQKKRDALLAQIHELQKEQENARGLFAGMKRKKLQREIDELNAQLRRI